MSAFGCGVGGAYREDAEFHPVPSSLLSTLFLGQSLIEPD